MNVLRRSGIHRLLAAAVAALVPAAPAAAQTVDPVRHELVIRDFHTESGVALPEARVVYGTYGTLDAAGDNAVLLPSHYMADLTGYAQLMTAQSATAAQPGGTARTAIRAPGRCSTGLAPTRRATRRP